jgi:hypothetical protein
MGVMSQVLVSYNKTDDTDLAKFESFNVLGFKVETHPEFEPKRQGLNTLIQEINNQMMARGYVKDEDNADLILNIGVSITKEQQTRETDIRDAPIYMGQRNYSWKSEEIVTGTFNEGTVTLDVVDKANNTMVWQAVVSGVLAEKREKNTKRIIRAVNKLFKKYPVPVAK